MTNFSIYPFYCRTAGLAQAIPDYSLLKIINMFVQATLIQRITCSTTLLQRVR